MSSRSLMCVCVHHNVRLLFVCMCMHARIMCRGVYCMCSYYLKLLYSTRRLSNVNKDVRLSVSLCVHLFLEYDYLQHVICILS